MKTSIKIFIFFFACHNAVVSQNFGFTTSKVALSNKSVKNSSNMIATSNHVYFINSVDSKIYDMFWDGASWATASAPLGGFSCPSVKNNTNIVNYNDEIFFVSSTDSKIYRLKWVNSTIGWQYAVLVNSQTTVASSEIELKINSNGYEIYYIGSNGKVCQIYYNGTSFSGGIQLSSIQSVNALINSKLVVTDVHVYYVGADRKVYDVVWNGTTWTGGAYPLVASSDLVKSGTNVINDGNHLFYVNDNSKLCDLDWGVSTGWVFNLISNSSGYFIRSGTQATFHDGSIFYVNSLDNKLWRFKKNGGVWNNNILNASSSVVATNTQFYVWSNQIYEEGSITQQFNSNHIFYYDVAANIRMLVYDDAITNFQAFCCNDQCDGNSNNTGWDSPTNPSTIQGICGFDCTSWQSVGKIWHYGALPTVNTCNLTVPICGYYKHFYYVASDGKIYDFLRGQINSPLRLVNGVLTSPTWQDEFNAGSLSSNWITQFNWGNHNPSACYNEYWNAPSNVSLGGGDVKISTQNPLSSPSTIPFHGIQNVWVGTGSCLPNSGGMHYSDKYYNYTTGMINTGHSSGPKFKFGYFETKLKAPRGKGYWPGFWLYSPSEDINVFEMEGNGKIFISTLYHKTNWYPAIKYYAVGYRFYDDYYTYAVDWNISEVKYYFNNEFIGSFPNEINPYTGQPNCTSPHEMIYTLEIDNSVRANCEAQIYPGEYKIDYIRVWNSTITRNMLPYTPYGIDANEIKNDFYLYPNPSSDFINIYTNSNKIVKVEIFKFSGELVAEVKDKSMMNNFNIQFLDNGVYFVKVILEDGLEEVQKFVKIE